MKRINMNLVYLVDSPEVDKQPIAVSLLSIPRVGDCFQRPYGRGKRYKVKAVVYEADSDACAIFVELVPI
jgi:hypothetical protein